jgi:hypothetical protein
MSCRPRYLIRRLPFEQSVGDTLHHTLNRLACLARDWLRQVTEPE